ncbi:MAG: hypothetical protein K2X48_20475 [Chitinophagaceae bacterium]|nr:hypothetical protein [Chitinophagaceae bacterium]
MKTKISFSLLLLISVCGTHAQMITGVWKGKVGNSIKPMKLELKLVQRGDSLFGTSYYFTSATNYRRYSVKGYFNQQTNEVVWWDDELMEEKTPGVRVLSPGEIPLLMEADFNCPGGSKMMLDGKAVSKDENKSKGDLRLEKTDQTQFADEWNWVIENYTAGANDPEIIDSIAQLSNKPVREPVVTSPPLLVNQEPTNKEEQTVIKEEPVLKKDTASVIVKTEPLPAPKKETTPVIKNPPAIQEKFVQRKKILTTELPLEGDTVEIHFYDNAEIDGDSISLFMNNRLVFEHVRLSDKPYIVKFSVKDLSETNELVMVAENLGSIPPNTSYMIAYINNQRYTANLESTEGSSAMIRFIRKKE